MTKGQDVGYIRVSSTGQNDIRQLEGVELDEVFREKASAGSMNRPRLKECINYLRKHDTLHVHSMDRLARNLRDLEKIIQDLNGKGVKVVFHKEHLTFSGESTSFDTLMLQVMGAFGQFERALAKERQREGIEAAKAQGKHLGRKPDLDKDQITELVKLAAAGAKKSHLARRYGLARATVYRYIKLYEGKTPETIEDILKNTG